MKHWRPLALALGVALLAGCGAEDPAKLMTSARSFLEKNDRDAAVIQLKTALQADPSLAEARFLLGTTLLDKGDAAAALIELDKALEHKYPPHLVIPAIARALNQSGQQDKLIERYGNVDLDPPASQADLKAALAMAFGALDRRGEALKAVQAALKAQPDHEAAGLFRARLMADDGNVDAALAAVEAILARRPQSADALLTKAELLAFGKRDDDAALAAYQAAAEIRPDSAPAHVGALRLLLAKKDLEGATAQLAKLRKVLPQHPQTMYFEGHVALLAKDDKKAREFADQLLHVSPNNPRVLQLAGAAAFERKDFAQAEQHLLQALRADPKQQATRRLLALTYLRQSQATKALALLQPLLEEGEPSAAMHNLLAQAHMQAGDLAQAESHFAKASRLDPANTRSRAALAVSRLAQGQGQALADLESIASTDTGTSADLPLISAYVGKKEYAKALKAIDALEAKIGGPQAFSWNLRAQVFLRKADVAAARQALGKSLELAPGFYPAAASLARLDLIDKRPEDARRRFDAVLAADPGSIPALMAVAALKVRAGAGRDEVLSTFREAIRQRPGSVPVRQALVSYHLGRNETAEALEAARQGAAAAAPNDPDMLSLLGSALLAAKDNNQAISTFNKLVKLQPESGLALLKLAEAQMAAGSRGEAIRELQRALQLEPGHLAIQRTLATALLAEGRDDEALALAGDIKRLHPAQELGFAVEGAVHASQKRWPQAIAAFQAGLKAVPASTGLATRLHAAWMASGQPAQASRWSTEWRASHPKDATFRFYLGDQALMRKDVAAAEASYREVMALQPDNALAINNVAWLLASSGRPGALELAERANKLLVNRPPILDTLALAHSRAGQPAKAVEILRQALTIEPSNASLRLNLAQALADSGDKPAAKNELKEVLKLGSSFGRIEEARTLMGTL